MKEEKKGISLEKMAGYYDAVTPVERSGFRKKQIEMVGLREGEKVLEVGCGTGSLSLPAKILVGDTGEVEGIDIAPRMVAKAQEKAKKAGLDIAFKVASIDELPYPDGHFDAVISSFMFHHLPVKVKERGLREIRRVLKDGGRLFLCDFCSPHRLTFPIAYLLFIWLEATRFQLFGKLPALIRECGFEDVRLVKKGIFFEYYVIRKKQI